ncbi:MAG: hypothetical protein K6E92_08660 [Lachnospiraceae bacterium]|nr:hypothetical protein [Lachnospiraceae bacterium]
MNYQETYDSLNSMEQKMQFLLELNVLALLNDQHGEPDQEMMEAAEGLKEQFLDTYVRGADDSARMEVLKTLGELNAKGTEELLLSKQEYLKSFPENDPDREAKAEYLTFMRIRGDGLKMILGTLTQDISEAALNPETREERWKKAGINEQTTWEEFADHLGYHTPESREEYLKNRGVEPKGLVLKEVEEGYYESHKHYGTSRESASKAAVEMLQQQLHEGQNRNVIEGAADAYLRSKYREEHFQTLKELRSKIYRSFDGESAIREWVEKDGIRNVEEAKAEDLGRIRTGFEEKIQRMTAASRGPAQTFPWMSDISGEISREECEQFREIAGLTLNEEGVRLHENSGSLMRTDLYAADFACAISGTDRTPTLNSVFTLWALGTQEGVNLSNFTKAAEDPELVKKFAEFCRDNPTRKATDQKTFEKACKAWGEAFQKGTDKMREYRIPEIDYHDPEAVRQILPEFVKIRSIMIDFSQEKDKTFLNDHFDGKRTVEEQIGKKNWSDTVGFWGDMQQGMGAFFAGFVAPLREASSYVSSVTDEAMGKAVTRAVAVRDMTENAGKTLGEMTKDLGEKSVLGFTLATNLADMYDDGMPKGIFEKLSHFEKEEAYDYLLGNHTEAFEQKALELEKALLTLMRTEVPMREAWQGINDFQGYGSAKDWEILGQLPEDPQAVQDFIKNGKLEKQNTADWLAVGMRKLFHENHMALLDKSGFSGLEMITINGKTPEELWGEKYAGVSDPALREQCLQVELMRQISRCETDIRMKYFSIAEDGTLTPDGEVTLLPEATSLQKVQQGLEAYREGTPKLLEGLKGLQNRLFDTHSDPESAKDEIGEVGSERFRRMERALDRCIRALSDDESSREEIERSFLEFRQAAEEYHLERANMSNRGADAQRAEIADQALRQAPEYLEEYRRLRSGLDTDIAASPATVEQFVTMRDASIHYISTVVERIGKGKKALYDRALDNLEKGEKTRAQEAPEREEAPAFESSVDRSLIPGKLSEAARANQEAERGVWFGSTAYKDAKEAFLKASESYRALSALPAGASPAERQAAIEGARKQEQEARRMIETYLQGKDAGTKDQKTIRRMDAMKQSLEALEDVRMDLDDRELELDAQRVRSAQIQAETMDRKSKKDYRDQIEQDTKTMQGNRKISAMGSMAALNQLGKLAAAPENQLSAKEMESARLCIASVVFHEMHREAEPVLRVKEGGKPEAAYAEAIRAFAASTEIGKAVQDLDRERLRDFAADPKRLSRQILRNLQQAGPKKQAPQEEMKKEQKPAMGRK